MYYELATVINSLYLNMLYLIHIQFNTNHDFRRRTQTNIGFKAICIIAVFVCFKDPTYFGISVTSVGEFVYVSYLYQIIIIDLNKNKRNGIQNFIILQ